MISTMKFWNAMARIIFSQFLQIALAYFGQNFHQRRKILAQMLLFRAF